MALWICHECCEEFNLVLRHGKSPTCPGCGPGTKVSAEPNPRQKGDDDGAEYSDPRDARSERWAD